LSGTGVTCGQPLGKMFNHYCPVRDE